MDLKPGQHLLEFERFNKTDDNTLVDQHGNIIQDQLVTLNEIWYENIRLPVDYLWQGTFCYNGHSLASVLCWGPNGTWSWPFQTPVLPWMINTRNQNRYQAAELFVPTATRVAEFMQKVSSISNDLNRF